MNELLRRYMLRPYQNRMVKLIKRKKRVILALDMGAGKTIISLTALAELFEAGEISRALIVAPKRVATDTWPDEIGDWLHTCHLTYSVAVGTEKERVAAVEADTQIVIINRENIPWLVKLRYPKWDFDALIYDEASRLKSGKKRTTGRDDGRRPLSEFGSLCKVAAQFKYVVELSGTIAPNGLIDLWGPCYIVDSGERLGASLTAFKQRWFDESRWTHKIEARPYAFAQIMERIRDIMFALRPGDYPQLPPVVRNRIHVSLPDKIMREYRRFKRELVSELYDVEAVNAGVLTGKLLQFANGSMYRNIDGAVPPKREVVEVHDLKLDALDSILVEHKGEQVLVAYSFDFDRDKIRKRFPKVVLFDEEPNFVKKWNEGKIGVGLVHPASAGHGLNLQKGGCVAVWYGLTWSLEYALQFEKRLHRPGQTKPVFIHYIISKGTDDERVLDVLSDKKSTQDDVIAYTIESIEGV